jgi:hypothetical protein
MSSFTLSRSEVLSLVTTDGDLLMTHSAFSDDPEVVIAASRSSVDALLWASPRLREDKAVLLAACSAHGRAIRYTTTLRSDPEVALVAVSQDGDALQMVSKELRDDKTIVLAAVSNSPYALAYASESLRKDVDCVVAALTLKSDVWRCVDAETQKLTKVKQAYGRSKAIEISQQRAKAAAEAGGGGETEQTKNHGGHGSHNSSRARTFVTFLLAAFPTINGPVLDVAGGAGEIACRLSFCHHVPTTTIDVVKSDLVNTLLKRVIPFLPKKWQERLSSLTKEDVMSLHASRLPTQYTGRFDVEEPAIAALLETAGLMIGMHADQVTEPIVAAALRHDVPCAVVPCCVFPNLFKQRRVDGREVRNCEQFVKYLVNLHPSLKAKALPFPGRNVCVYRYAKRLSAELWRPFVADYSKIAILLGRTESSECGDAIFDRITSSGGADLVVFGCYGDQTPSAAMKHLATRLGVCVCVFVLDRLGESLKSEDYATHYLAYSCGVGEEGSATPRTGAEFYLNTTVVSKEKSRVYHLPTDDRELVVQEVEDARKKGYRVEVVEI